MKEADKKIIKNLTVDQVLQCALNVALVSLALILCGLLMKEIFHLVQLAFFATDKNDHELLESILVFFLYFEFIAMIVKYFREEYHFPLRYFMYIGITAMIRLIVVVHDDAWQTLLFSVSILILVIGYFLINNMHARFKR